MTDQNQKGILEAQIISKILNKKSWDIIEKYGLDSKYFNTIIQDDEGNPLANIKDIFNFIKNHKQQYKMIPDKSTVLANFPDFTIVDVDEDDKYLVNNLKKAYNTEKIANGINNFADILVNKGDIAAISKIKDFINGYEDTSYSNIGLDLIHEGAQQRLNTFIEAMSNPEKVCISTGLKELDEVLGGGWYRQGEFAVVQARTGHSKSFFLIKFLYECWNKGENVALYEPEMDANGVGYRLDSIIEQWSNFKLRQGKDIQDTQYKSYIKKLQERPNKFFFLTPKDFQNTCTVSKLREFCKLNNIKLLGIDGMEVPRHIIDERATKNTPIFSQIGDVATDFLEMSRELQIPVIAVAQANRQDKDTELDVNTVSGSYDIPKICTFMMAIKKDGRRVTIRPIKTRNSDEGKPITYLVDLDKGIWQEDSTSDVAITKDSGEVRQQSDISQNVDDIDTFG